MQDRVNDKRPHLVLTKTSKAQSFTAPSAGGGGKSKINALDRFQHGTALQTQLRKLKPYAEQAVAVQKEQDIQSGLGLQIQFVSLPDVTLAFESLGSELGRDPGKQIEVLSVRTDGDTTLVNVFVPEGKLNHFEKYIEDYLAAKTDKNGTLKDHGALLNAIASIRTAELKALWTDVPALLPADVSEKFWWEIWLPVRGRRNDVVEDFHKLSALARSALIKSTSQSARWCSCTARSSNSHNPL